MFQNVWTIREFQPYEGTCRLLDSTMVTCHGFFYSYHSLRRRLLCLWPSWLKDRHHGSLVYIPRDPEISALGRIMCLLTRPSQSFDAFVPCSSSVYRNCRSFGGIINISERSGSSLDFASNQEETQRQHCKHKHAAGQRRYIITPALHANQSGICVS